MDHLSYWLGHIHLVTILFDNLGHVCLWLFPLHSNLYFHVYYLYFKINRNLKLTFISELNIFTFIITLTYRILTITMVTNTAFRLSANFQIIIQFSNYNRFFDLQTLSLSEREGDWTQHTYIPDWQSTTRGQHHLSSSVWQLSYVHQSLTKLLHA